MATANATAPVIPAEQVRIAEGRCVVLGPDNMDKANSIISRALTRHAGDSLDQTTRLVGMADLLSVLADEGLMDEVSALYIALAATEAARLIVMGGERL